MLDALFSLSPCSLALTEGAPILSLHTLPTDTLPAEAIPTHTLGFVWLRTLIITCYLTLLALIAMYGLHRYWLVWLFYRHRKRQPRVTQHFSSDQLPNVTVQLPMFNEASVAQRIIDAACHLNYPADRLQIQVLDDSTLPTTHTHPATNSAHIAQQRCEYWANRGINIQYIHRTDRIGYKAGALNDAMTDATGQLIAIFDADFVPPPNFLQRTVHHFQSPDVGMVQTRWGHLNRNSSMLTRAQAMFLDGHFIIEHAARCRANRWFNFNGTAGIWRRQAISDAGGWQHDTLTEDVDLSYRAQLAGWRFVYLPRLSCPAELPPEINAFKSQQHRWNKGSIQTARKLLPTLLRAKTPLGIKIEAFFHLTSPMVYLYIVLITLLFLPIILLNLNLAEENSLIGYLLGASLLLLGTCSAGVFYTASQREQKRPLLPTLLQMPAMMSIGIGMAVNNARACIEALIGHDSPFIRTPKFNDTQYFNTSGSNPDHSDNHDQTQPSTLTTRRPSIKSVVIAFEIIMGGYMLLCTALAMQQRSAPISVPFLLLFASGYLYVGLSSLLTHLQHHRATRRQLVIQSS